jgi:hypothetical protein
MVGGPYPTSGGIIRYQPTKASAAAWCGFIHYPNQALWFGPPILLIILDYAANYPAAAMTWP